MNNGPFMFQSYGQAMITPPFSGTPTISGFGTVTNNTQFTARVGSFAFVNGIFTSGVSGASQARIDVVFQGAAQTIDSSKLAQGSIVWMFAVGANSGNYNTIITPGSNVTYVNMGVGTAGTNPLAPANGSALSGATGQAVGYFFSVPILGW